MFLRVCLSFTVSLRAVIFVFHRVCFGRGQVAELLAELDTSVAEGSDARRELEAMKAGAKKKDKEANPGLTLGVDDTCSLFFAG